MTDDSGPVLAITSEIASELPLRYVDANSVVLRVTDLAVSRGDAVFETIAFFDGEPHALDSHLRRLRSSARLLDLPDPDPSAWRAAILDAGRRHPPSPELFAKAVISRGNDTIVGDAHGWVYVGVPADHSERRRRGIAVATLSKGVTRTASREAPWLLMSAKTLSYAVNMAATREARRRNADEAIFLTVEGYVMEAPISSVIALQGDRLITPDPSVGILHGTTQRALFAIASSFGLRAEYTDIHVDQLMRADAVWIIGSGSLAIPVHTIDGVGMPVDGSLTSAMNDALRSEPRA